MVDVAQLVEPRIVIPVVAGSIPVVHPINILYKSNVRIPSIHLKVCNSDAVIKVIKNKLLMQRPLDVHKINNRHSLPSAYAINYHCTCTAATEYSINYGGGYERQSRCIWRQCRCYAESRPTREHQHSLS